jgi:hypothetical protein
MVEQAERFHEKAGGPPLYVRVFFHEHNRLKKRYVCRFGAELASVILSRPAPRDDSEVMFPTPWHDLPEWVADIHARPVLEGEGKFWHADASGWVAKVTSEHVSDVVLAKASREPRARFRCDELWLVIVNDHFSRAAQAEMSDEALSAAYQGPFDRLIWLLPHAPRAIDLRLTRT